MPGDGPDSGADGVHAAVTDGGSGDAWRDRYAAGSGVFAGGAEAGIRPDEAGHGSSRPEVEDPGRGVMGVGVLQVGFDKVKAERV